MAIPPRLTTTVGHEPPPSSPPGITFPASLNLYDTTHLHRHPRAYLGTHKSQPSHHISPDRNGWVNLHAGPEKTTRVVARYAHRRGRHHHHPHLHLRHGRNSGDDKPVPAPAPPHVTFPLGRGRPVRLEGAFPYRFRMDVPAPMPVAAAATAASTAAGHGSASAASAPPPPTTAATTTRTTRTEAFEWRHSQGAAVRRTGRRSGYKLVRLATDAGACGGGGELATGGGEVVAVFAARAGPSWRSRAGVFMFQGSGAQGVLGAQWQLVAVMTAVGFWDAARRSGRAAGPGG